MSAFPNGMRPTGGGLYQLAAALGLSFTLVASPRVFAGDILRGGAPAGVSRGGGAAGVGGGPTASTAQSRAHAQEALARTTQALQAVKAMQAAARNVALSGPVNLGRVPNQPGRVLPNVPNGLAVGGLQVAPGVPANLSAPAAGENATLWRGAKLPTQTLNAKGQTTVTVEQTRQQALLNWKTFNVGRETTLVFDQSAGGADQSQWIAFNKINDPSGLPSQILGSIRAPGQVYVINQNGIIFGGSSQVNLHTLVASSLPLNDNLFDRGLLNNPDLQFLFSSLEIPVLAGGTMPIFTPEEAHTPDGRPGDVIVQAGATLTSPTTADHVGGRIALVGSNVRNAGTISTPDGQTILAAGQQVGFQAHSTSDPSLRGLDVFVGKVTRGSGTATNAGLIEGSRANVTIAGKTVEQLGAIESSTSVALNGRIDLVANYNTVRATRPNGERFFNVSASGLVHLGEGSSTRILPEWNSDQTVVGLALPLASQINLQGLAIHLSGDAQVLAPGAAVSLLAGSWQPANGAFAFTFDQGQIYLDAGAAINVAGSTDIAAPISQNIVEAQLRGPELADSPLQRLGLLRGSTIQIDVRKGGSYNGQTWIGTPLANAAGYVGLIERSVGQLTTAGGTINLTAGNSVILQRGATMDVSGGWMNYGGGLVQTTRLLAGGHVVDISQATPDQVYDGIYTGLFNVQHAKWGVTQEFTNPLYLSGAHYEQAFTQGAAGGTISITAPAMALDGTLRGQTVSGTQQRISPPVASTLTLAFQAQDPTERPGLPYPTYSPTPPKVVFIAGSSPQQEAPGQFALGAGQSPESLRADRVAKVVLSADLVGEAGFGNLKIENSDGNITVPAGVTLKSAAGGSVILAGANIDIQGQVSAPGGTLSFSVFNYSPAGVVVLNSVQGAVTPEADDRRGHFTLGATASLDASGLIVDDRRSSAAPLTLPLATGGGSITISTYSANLSAGSVIDVSGGVSVAADGKRSYGNAGTIVIRAGQDPNLASLLGGELVLESRLSAYSGSKGGSLSILAPLIRIGTAPSASDTLRLAPDFFNQGGFSSFNLSGLAGVTGDPNRYRPGLVIAPGTVLAPSSESLVAVLEDGGDVSLQPMRQPVGVRTPVSLSFGAVGVLDAFTKELVARGDLVMGAGSLIQTDPLANVSLSGDTAAVLGSIRAPGGSISVSGGKTFLSLVPAGGPLPTVDLGPQSVLSVAGTTLLTPDPRDLRTGTVLPGGRISIAGNIVAEGGALLDVSGTSGILDLLPGYSEGLALPPTGGDLLNGSLAGSVRVPTLVSSNAGSIELKGAQELFSNATLLGAAGGPGAQGGSLSIASGRFYPPGVNTLRTPLDVTLFLTQSDSGLAANFYPAGSTAIGQSVCDAQGEVRFGLGYFAADQTNGFDVLNLHGTVRFSGAVSFQAARSLTIADGGVIFADPSVANSTLHLSAPYVALGAAFQAPLTADQEAGAFFDSELKPFFFAPTHGSGQLTVTADLIDLGNLSLQRIGQANLFAEQGDLRGNGTLDVAGDLVIRAGQIYPPTASRLTLAAYDYESGGSLHLGSVSIYNGTVLRNLPLSAGGELNIYASVITQSGTLRAPIGTINLGWDGTGAVPVDLIAGSTATLATTRQLTLAAGSVTSVSAVDPRSGEALVIPYGLNLNEASWIDPRGTDITAQGAPAKRINLSALNVADQAGSTIDLRGGGDLYAYRFVKGLGGSRDLLASTTSFAVIPGYQANYAPYAPFSTTPLTDNLGGDAGYVNAGLNVGDRIYLSASAGLPAGTYTLLPARYALLPGAFLVTPQAGNPTGTLSLPEGSSLVSGYRFNGVAAAAAALANQPLNARFEVASFATVRDRAEYSDFSANSFFKESALARESAVPRLPVDAGQLVLQATQSLAVQGRVLAQATGTGRGGLVDISSPVDILIAGPGTAPQDGVLTLDASVLSAFGAESLLIGGVRDSGPDGTSVEVQTGRLTVDNAGTPLSGSDLILVAKERLTLAPGAQLNASGTLADGADTLHFGSADEPGSGNGLLLRVSADPQAAVERSGVDDSSAPQMVIGAGAILQGAGLILDSTSATHLDSAALLLGQSISLNSGQISLLLNQPGPLQATTGLVLSAGTLQTLQAAARSLSLLSYSSIDIYGTGAVGAVDGTGQATLENLALHAAQIRGFNTGGGRVQFTAQNILLDNLADGSPLEPREGDPRGTLAFSAETLRLGVNPLAIAQFATLELNASERLLFEGAGRLRTDGALTLTTPLLTGATAASQTITAGGAVLVQKPGGAAHAAGSPASEGLGAHLALSGASLRVDSDIVLRSGALTLQARSGDLQVGTSAVSRLDVSGTAHRFYDLTEYTGGGQISLIAEKGLVKVGDNATVTVAAQPGAGDAGSLSISAPEGALSVTGALLGQGGLDGANGSFALDVGQLPTLSVLNGLLNAAAFTETRTFRVRTGDVLLDGLATAHSFTLSADQGSIQAGGTIDASGRTGGTIYLSAAGSVALSSGARLSVAGENFDHAGKGGAVSLEAGSAINGLAAPGASLVLESGAVIDLSVASNQGAASAALGRFTGTLHLRAPQTANHKDLNVAPLDATIRNASSIVVEGYQLFDLSNTNGVVDAQQAKVLSNGQLFAGNTVAMSNRLLAGNSQLAPVVHIRPGAEIVNSKGNLTLTKDWDLSTFRFGPNNEPGILTLRAAGNLVFEGSLSDGFETGGFNPNTGGFYTLAESPLMAAGSQSWSYRLTAGADLAAADFHQVQSLTKLAKKSGSLLLGKDGGINISLPFGPDAVTASALAGHYQVIRTGTGDIDISTGRDLRLLNQFATIYTAGTQVADPTLGGTFDLPLLFSDVDGVFSLYPAQYSLGGGNVSIAAQGNILHLTRDSSGKLIADSERQMPTNWLYRRGYVDPATAQFGVAKFGDVASTSWWVDFSNFFEGVGALGGGNVRMVAGGDIRNVDAVVPTNARLAKGTPDAGKLIELGGGDLVVEAGRDIDGGVYYVERGEGTLRAGESIHTNSTRSPSLTSITGEAPLAPETWLPMTLFLGKGSFEVSARGDLLLGPVANPFLLPGGINNSIWDKTYFSTYAPEDYVTANSLAGSVTLRTNANVSTAGIGSAVPLLQAWYGKQLLLTDSGNTAAYYQPWLRLNETSVAPFATVAGLLPPALRVTAFSGDINLNGGLTLFPAVRGTLELAAAGSINGLQPNGLAIGTSGAPLVTWGASRINLSDANPASIYGVASPYAYQVLAGTVASQVSVTTGPILLAIDNLFAETGSTQGINGVLQTKQALHAPGLLHADDPNPLRLYAEEGDISGFTLFSGKASRILAGRDLTDIALYLQNVADSDISVVSAGRDILAYNANSPSLIAAQAPGQVLNFGSLPQAGDLQLGGPGTLEILAGRDLNLGVGPSPGDGTGRGITTIGNARNPYLSSEGAAIVAGAGVGGPAALANSSLDFPSFIDSFLTSETPEAAAYLAEMEETYGLSRVDFEKLSPEAQAPIALQFFYRTLRDAGRDHSKPGAAGFGNYDAGFAAIDALFPKADGEGDISLTSRQIKTQSGGSISLFAPGGQLTVGFDVAGVQSSDQGILTEDGGDISIFTKQSVIVGTSRIFTLRGGDEVLWSSEGNIAAGASSKTVQSAPPTRVLIDPQSGDVKTDLAGLATGGGIGVLATVAGVEPGDVDLIAPGGIIDAGDAGIRVSGNLNISAVQVLNASNIQSAGSSVGATAPAVAAPNLSGLTAAANTAGAGTATASDAAKQAQTQAGQQDPLPSIITVEVIGYGGGEG